MVQVRFTEEFRQEAVRQVVERGHSVADVAQRLGVTTCSVYQWKKRFGQSPAKQTAELDQHAEIGRLKAELRRVTEERDILRKAAAYVAKG